MKGKGILKIISLEKERIMHYVKEDEMIFILSLNDALLVEEIKKNPHVLINFDLKSNEPMGATVSINQDVEMVKALFQQMLKENHTYFKEFDERLIILQITLDQEKNNM